MGLFSNKISRDDLKPGDHIYSWRSYIYSHHGIYVGDGKVIHFTRGGGLEIGTGTFLDKIIVSSVPNHRGGDNPCLSCGDQSNLDGVISSCLDCFLAGGNLYLFEYNVSKAVFLAKQRGGTCTLAASDPSDEVISRAKLLLAKNGFGRYHVLDNNCEDFAIYCKSGMAVLSITRLGSSGQVHSVCAAGGVVSLTLKVLGMGTMSSQAAASVMSADSTVSAAKYAFSSSLGFAGAGFCGMALAGYGNYCIGRLNSDIGVRADATKVPVERLLAVVAAMEGRLDNNVCKTS